MATDYPERFKHSEFMESWTNGSGIEAFNRGLEKTRFLKIGRYPTLTFTRNNLSKGIMDVLEEALTQMLD